MVYCVPKTGFSRTYLIEVNEPSYALIAVDVGCMRAARSVTRFIEHHLKKSLEDVKFITATHFHVDHIGGIGYLLDQCGSSTKVLFNGMIEGYLEGESQISSMQRWLAAFIPAAARCLRCSYLSCDVVSNFMVGSFAGIPFPPFRNNFHSVPYGPERIEYIDLIKSANYDLGFGGWAAILTPGHTEDSLSFYNPSSRELICGDLILNLHRPWKGALNRFYWSEEAIKASFNLLKNTLQPQAIYLGHGEVIRNQLNALQGVEDF